jgi:hypothetical protein
VKLTLRKIGGVTGAAGAVTHTLDLDALPAAQRAKALARVVAARLGHQPSRLFLPHPRPWDFRYVLDVEPGHAPAGAEPGAHHLELHLDAADPPLRALVEWLEKQGGPR